MAKKNADSVLSSSPMPDEEVYDRALRPKTLAEFIGQPRLKDNLRVFLEAARKRKEPLDHCLFYSPPGLGKTTLANILAREMGVNLRTASGPILERAGDLGGALGPRFYLEDGRRALDDKFELRKFVEAEVAGDAEAVS